MYLEILDKLNKFETKENIENLNSEYGNLWPLFRVAIFNFYYNKSTNLKYKNRLFRTLSHIKQNIKEGNICIDKIKNYTIINDVIDEIWYSSSNLRIENKEGFNKYMDPFFNELSSANSLMIESDYRKYYSYTNKNIKSNYLISNIKYDIINFNRNRFISQNKLKFNEFKDKYKVEELSAYFPEISTYHLFITFSTFVKDFNFFKFYLKYFPSLKRVFYTAYYGVQNIAFIAVANKMNIETIDVQHGVQSDGHFAYGRWNYVPIEGYSLVPSIFYIFTNKEKRILNKTFKGTSQVKIVGNLMFEKWKEKVGSEELRKDTILFTLQNKKLEDYDFIFDFFKYLNSEYSELKIVFRVHPRHLYIKDNIGDLLKANNIIFEWDNNSEVYDSLKRTLLHITLFSSVVEDALNMNIPSFVIDKLGKEIYKDHIENISMVKYVNSLSEVKGAFNVIFNKTDLRLKKYIPN